MAIGAIETQGQILLTQDYAAIKHLEDAHGQVEQAQIQVSKDEDEVRQANRVSGTQESTMTSTRDDASDKGSNEYTGDGGARRREAREARERDGKVLLKAVTHVDLQG